MKRLVYVLTVLIAVLVLGPPALGKIAVGKGIDGVRLGDSLSTVKHKLGRPQHTARNATGTSFRLDYTKRKLVISLDKKHGVTELNTFNKHERTAKGVGPGSTFAAVRKAYPGACADLEHYPVCAVNAGKVLTQFSSATLPARRVDVVKVKDLRY